MADYVVSQKPDARVAIVVADDATGTSAGDGFRYVLEQSGGEVSAFIGHDVTQSDMTAQVRQAVDSDPDWIMYYGLPTNALNLMRALRETVGRDDIPVILRGLLPAEGVSQYMDGVTYIGQSLIDPIAYADDPTFAKLEQVANEEGIGFQQILSSLALANFEHLVRALEMAGPDLTREGIVEAIESGFDGSWTCSICLAPTILSPYDHWTYEAARVSLWHEETKTVEFKSEVLDYETSHGNGIRGNFPDFPCEEDNCPWKQ
jgi:ABC-type branched-subunit amino acid transport system substrate-binding protein